MTVPATHFRLTATRHTSGTGVHFAHVFAGVWRHVHVEGGAASVVGPEYRTRAELLADHDRYMHESWGVLDANPHPRTCAHCGRSTPEPQHGDYCAAL